jgi:drug/metabolite transporter (DMT)-like permease
MWIFATLFAVLCQIARTGFQKDLQNKISNSAGLTAKFIFSLPVALIFLTFLAIKHPLALHLNWKFVLLCLSVSVLQIVFTIAFLLLLKRVNLAVMVTFLKTEVIQAFLIGIALGLNMPSYSEFLLVFSSFFGIILLSSKNGTLKWDFKSAFYGILCGFLTASAGFVAKQSFTFVLADKFFIKALTLLVFNNIFQALIVGIFLIIRGRFKKAIGENLAHIKASFAVGTCTILSYLGWFWAYSIAVISHVKLLGQAEVVIGVILSRFLFSEKIQNREKLGILIVLSCILGLIILEILK